jgi:carbon-monoxide dehydrogenase large subunit
MPDTSVPDGTTTRFGIGQPVPRNEDPVLHTGQGRYTDDIALPGQLWCVIVRSQHARGRIRGIDTTMAKAMPGVRAVCAGADLDAAGCGRLRRILPFTNADGTPMQAPERGALATDRVRFVDDPVACVIAETRAQARDAAEAVVVDVDPLPAVVEASAAAAPGAQLLFDRPGGTVVLDFH